MNGSMVCVYVYVHMCIGFATSCHLWMSGMVSVLTEPSACHAVMYSTAYHIHPHMHLISPSWYMYMRVCYKRMWNESGVGRMIACMSHGHWLYYSIMIVR